MHANRFFQTVYILVNTLDLIDRDIFSIPDDSIRTPSTTIWNPSSSTEWRNDTSA